MNQITLSFNSISSKLSLYFKWAGLCLVLPFLGACQPKPEQLPQTPTIKVTDSVGNEVVLNQPAKRIVTLVPHAAEMVISAGATDRLVGVSNSTDLPEEVSVPSVGAYNKTNMESILAQTPDLVIAWTEGEKNQEQIQKLKAAGIAVYVSNPINLVDIAKEVTDIGTLTGTEEIAQTNAQQFLNELQKIKTLYQDKSDVSVFIQLGKNPVYTISDKSFLGKSLEYCHASNVFGKTPQSSFTVNPEQVIKADPQVILSLEEEEPLKIWKKWPLRAQKQQNMYIAPKSIARPSLNILLGLQDLCKKINQARST